jgi:hypothetical protein
MMGIMVPETCWADNKFCNKNHSVASSWPFISTYQLELSLSVYQRRQTELTDDILLSLCSWIYRQKRYLLPKLGNWVCFFYHGTNTAQDVDILTHPGVGCLNLLSETAGGTTQLSSFVTSKFTRIGMLRFSLTGYCHCPRVSTRS